MCCWAEAFEVCVRSVTVAAVEPLLAGSLAFGLRKEGVAWVPFLDGARVNRSASRVPGAAKAAHEHGGLRPKQHQRPWTGSTNHCRSSRPQSRCQAPATRRSSPAPAADARLHDSPDARPPFIRVRNPRPRPARTSIAFVQSATYTPESVSKART